MAKEVTTKKLIEEIIEGIRNRKDAKVENGILGDVAPSICHILGIEQPTEMTGHNLIK